jgi:cyclopropane fatty-acyl-phospholipid synthase-like methyltransferase
VTERKAEGVSERSAAFYDGIAGGYDAQMAGEGDARIRAAFWAFVEARVPRGARLLDFGCGTGVDAARYASEGYRVLAYDNSHAMLDGLRRRCAGEITRGEVDAWSAPYETFRETLAVRAPVDAVTANFAAVNHLPDVAAWLDLLADATTPGAAVLVSSLSACPLPELQKPVFWRRALRYRRDVGIPFPGYAYDHVRLWPWAVGRGSAAFRMVSRMGAGGVPRGLPAWLFGRFTFVELRRR